MDQKNENRPELGRTTKKFLDWVNADENLPTLDELEHDHGDDHDGAEGHEKDHGHGATSDHSEPEVEIVTVVEVIEIDEELIFPDPILEEDLILEEKVIVTDAGNYQLDHEEGHAAAAKKPKRAKRNAKRRKNNTSPDRFFYVFLGSVLALIIIAALVFTVSFLPAFGSPDNPTVRDNEVYEKYIVDGQKDTGAVNIVAAMILDYRAFDTLGESVMLFTATMAVIMLIREPKKEPLASDDGRRKHEPK